MGTVQAIPAREFLKFKPKELLDGLKSSKVVLFEDNIVVTMSANEVIVNRYLWDVYNLIPELPLLSKYNITNYYTNGIFSSKSINKLFAVILEDMFKKILIPSGDTSFKDIIYKQMYITVNNIYNEVVYANLNYASSMNILDLLDIQLNDKLIKAMQNVADVETPESIEDTYRILDEIMYDENNIKNNSLARSYVSGQINTNQAKQVLASRGFVSEIDGSIFSKPIASSFTLGLTNMYDVAAESRSASKALFLADKAIQDSEYFSRELQLVCMEVENIVIGDCGNTTLTDWRVRSADETISGKSDLNNLVGKHFLNETTGEMDIITKDRKDLIGNTIKIRSVMHCKHHNKHKVCSACLGELTHSLFNNTNLGHIAAGTLTQKLTQSILSTKHLTGSASGGAISLDALASRFFMVKNKDGYAFKPGIINKDVKMNMIINQSDAFGIKQLMSGTDMTKLDPSRISRIESMVISVEKNDKIEYFPIIIKDGNKYGSFTYKFLEYIVKTGYNIDNQNRYVISLDKWKSAVPILKLPQIEFSYIVLANKIKSMLKSMKVVKGIHSLETQESLLQNLFDTINSKLDVNIALLEIIVYAFTISSIVERDYTLGRFSDDKQLAGIMDCVSNRSLGSGYAYQRVPKQILDPHSFSSRKRSNHLLDTIVKPNETLIDYYGSLVSSKIVKKHE